MFERWSTVALLAAAGLLFVHAGGAGVGPAVFGPAEPDPAPETLLSETTGEHPTALEGRFSTVIERNGTELERTTYDVVDRPGRDELRVRITDDDGSRMTIVINETTAWRYDADDGEVLVLDRDQQDIIVPSLEYEHYPDLAEDFEAEYAGSDRIAGHDTHVVALSPETTGASLDVLVGQREYRLVEATVDDPLVVSEHRVWVDTEHTHPLKERTTMTGPDGETVTLTNRYERVTFDVDLDEEAFEFEPPDDAEIRQPATFEEYETVEAAAEVVPFSIPQPELPAGYERQRVSVADREDSTLLSVAYADGEERTTVTVAETDHSAEPRGVSVDIDGREGMVVDTRSGTMVQWSCSERIYRIGGSEPAETQLDVAASIDC